MTHSLASARVPRMQATQRADVTSPFCQTRPLDGRQTVQRSFFSLSRPAARSPHRSAAYGRLVSPCLTMEKPCEKFSRFIGSKVSRRDPRRLALGHIAKTYAPFRHAAGRLARTVDATPATAKNWLRRLNAPHADHIGVLIERDPDFRAKMRAFIEACDAQNLDH